LTYISLIVGELVPKRVALAQPERIASLIARPMQWLATIASPLIHVLSISTNALLTVLRVRRTKEPNVTIEEIKVLIEQGTEEGIVEETEHELITNVLNLDERKVGSILTPRADIVFLDLQKPFEDNQNMVSAHPHSVLPLCDGGLESVIGFVRSTDIVKHVLRGRDADIDWRALALPPLFIPSTMTLMHLLERLRQTHLPVALVVDESGSVDGIVSLTDVMSAIVGDLPPEPGHDPEILRREDGSWLMDGRVDMHAVRRVLGAGSLAASEPEYYHTLGGFVMFALGRVPRTGDIFERDHFRFEVVDMDGNRIDRVLIRTTASNTGKLVRPVADRVDRRRDGTVPVLLFSVINRHGFQARAVLFDIGEAHEAEAQLVAPDALDDHVVIFT
jgi:putative hemolysin